MPINQAHAELHFLIVRTEQRGHPRGVARATGVFEQRGVVQRAHRIGIESDGATEAHRNNGGAQRVSGTLSIGEVERVRERRQHFGETNAGGRTGVNRGREGNGLPGVSLETRDNCGLRGFHHVLRSSERTGIQEKTRAWPGSSPQTRRGVEIGNGVLCGRHACGPCWCAVESVHGHLLVGPTAGIGAQLSPTAGIGAQLSPTAEIGAQLSPMAEIGAQLSSWEAQRRRARRGIGVDARKCASSICYVSCAMKLANNWQSRAAFSGRSNQKIKKK